MTTSGSTSTPAADLNAILYQCFFALGSGARMPIKRQLLSDIRPGQKGLEQVVRAAFQNALDRPADPVLNPRDSLLPPPGLPRWDGVPPDFVNGTPGLPGIAEFILRCCVAIGELAAANAKARGSIVIELQDLRPAYNTVSALFGGGVPGEWCPLW